VTRTEPGSYTAGMDTRRSLRWSLFALSLCASVAACSDDGAGERGGKGRVNVLLISLDSTRRDLLSCYGRRPLHAPERSTCPNLDRLAAGGVVFEDAYTTTSWTLPSHVSMFTGLSGVEHAVDESVHSYDGAQPMLAEILRGHGFGTAGFYSGPFLGPAFGFGRGFERYEACYGSELVEAAGTARARIEQRDAAKARGDRQAYVRLYKAAEDAEKALQAASHRDVSSLGVTDSVLEELERRARGDEPFFLFAHYFDPHYDYTPPAEHDLFDPDYAGSIDGNDFFDSPLIAGPATGPGARERRVPERDLERVLSLYEGELSWTDAQVGRILDRLDELDLARNTLVIVTSDHGDEFFEHGAIGHRRTLFEEVVRVPLIVRLPGTIPAGERASGLVSIQDIPATVLEALALPATAGASSRSFLQLVRGEPVGSEDGADRAVLARLVMSFPFSYSAGSNAMPGRARRVVETYRVGPIKIVRARAWTEPMGRTNSPLDERWAEETRRRRSAEELSWIDVEAHPDEPAEQFSTSFDDARAKAALSAFRELYAELVARRGESSFVEQDEGLRTMLRGLGYTAGDGEDEASTDALVLPPPGEGLVD